METEMPELLESEERNFTPAFVNYPRNQIFFKVVENKSRKIQEALGLVYVDKYELGKVAGSPAYELIYHHVSGATIKIPSTDSRRITIHGNDAQADEARKSLESLTEIRLLEADIVHITVRER